MSGVEIRAATAADAGAVLELIRELADYEHEPDAVEADEKAIASALSGPDPVARAFVVVDTRGGTGAPVSDAAPATDAAPVVGMALWFRTFSTWTGRPGIWLEDLYVRPSHRREGLGRQLLQRLAAECVANGWSRLEWTVLDWNTPAHAFYRSVGAVATDDWTTNRVTGAALTALADPSSRPVS